MLDPGTDADDFLRANRTREKQYAFDYAFDHDTPQETVYHYTTRFLIDGTLDGFNATGTRQHPPPPSFSLSPSPPPFLFLLCFLSPFDSALI